MTAPWWRRREERNRKRKRKRRNLCPARGQEKKTGGRTGGEDRKKRRILILSFSSSPVDSFAIKKRGEEKRRESRIFLEGTGRRPEGEAKEVVANFGSVWEGGRKRRKVKFSLLGQH